MTFLRRPSHGKGFSLIEIMLAMGIMVFAVVSLIGLLSVGVSAGKYSQVATLESMVAQETVASLHTNLASWDAITFTNAYFDFGGQPLPGRAGAYFSCLIKALPDDPATSPWATNSLRRFQLTIISPVSSVTPLTNVFQSAIAKPIN